MDNEVERKLRREGGIPSGEDNFLYRLESIIIQNGSFPILLGKPDYTQNK